MEASQRGRILLITDIELTLAGHCAGGGGRRGPEDALLRLTGGEQWR